MLPAALLELAEEEELERERWKAWLASVPPCTPACPPDQPERDRQRREERRREAGGQEQIGDHTGEKIAATASAIRPKSDRRFPVRVLVS